MQLQMWAKRAAAASLALWIVVLTIYLVLGFVEHEVLPSPYNVMIMLVLSTITSGCLAAWLAGCILAEVARIKGALIADADLRSARDERITAHLMHIGRRLDDLESTRDLQRAPLVAVGSASVPEPGLYRRGYEDAMAARPDAKVIQLGATPHP